MNAKVLKQGHQHHVLDQPVLKPQLEMKEATLAFLALIS